MPNYSFLKNILVEIEEFKSEKGGYPQNVKEFAHWLYYDRMTEDERQQEFALRIDSYGRNFGGNIANTISNLFTSMHRIKMHYIKLILDNSALETYDEFSFLLTIYFNGPHTHSRLIERHLINKATGTEIIRRLLRKNFLIQTTSASDKRNKLLSITESGKDLLGALMEKVSIISNLMLLPISENEAFLLIEVLEKLNTTHRNIIEMDKKLSIEDILGKYKEPVLKS